MAIPAGATTPARPHPSIRLSRGIVNYQKHYDALIARARSRVLSGYKESHHIIPRCMGGSDRKSNLVGLTAEEHYVAHQLLAHIYPENHKLVFAARAMTIKSRLTPGRNNKEYGWVRRRAMAAMIEMKNSPEFRARFSAAMRASESLMAFHESRRGVPRTEDEQRKISESHKTSQKAAAARQALFVRKIGRPRSEETRRKLSEVQIGKVLTAEHRAKIGAAHKGRTLAPEHIAKVSAALTGKPGTRRGAITSEETKAKQRAAALARVYTPDSLKQMAEMRMSTTTPEQRSEAARKAWATKRAKLAQSTE